MTEYHTFVDFVRDSKILEYGVAFLFMGAFAVLYRIMHKPAPAHATATVSVMQRALDSVRGFLLPEGLAYHPGHTWAMAEANNVASMGVDDFAAKLLGPVDAVRLPQVGQMLEQGEPAWSVMAGGKSVDMLAPVGGTVVAINEAAVANLADDPFGAGWLVKIQSPSLKANLKNLLSGQLAKAWTEQSVDALFARANMPLGAMAADGGAPVSGMARNIDADGWDQIAKECFLTND